jgi:hypothetical protein
MRDTNRIKYLESLLPIDEKILDEKYQESFEKYATYTGNGTYQWRGLRATDTRELWLMGILSMERIEFEQV